MLNQSLTSRRSSFGSGFDFPYFDATVAVIAAGSILLYWRPMKRVLFPQLQLDSVEKKQGAYGKVKTHKESKLAMLGRPSEVVAMLQVKWLTLNSKKGSSSLVDDLSLYTPEQLLSLEFCVEKLKQVSRSFALVITFLPEKPSSPLRLGVAIFYLVLRALDTIEDEMDLSKFECFILPEDRKITGKRPALAAKERLLNNFYNVLSDSYDGQVLSGLGEGHELQLLDDFQKVVEVFLTLPRDMQAVIVDITKEMGEGMSDYVSRDLRDGTTDEDDFAQYCYIVAGTVGKGLTSLFAVYDPSLKSLLKHPSWYKSMGEFLQRTNIIRDYLEDFVDGRAFWPQSVWKQHLVKDATPSIGEFAKPEMISSGRSVECLNHMIDNSLKLLPDVVQYVSRIDDPAIYSFCALPQIMALATLTECCDNSKVFTGVVKLRKGESAKIVRDFAPRSYGGIDRLRLNCASWISLCLNKMSRIAARSETAKSLQLRVSSLLNIVGE